MPYSVGELAVIPMEVTRSEGYSTRYLVRSDHRLRRAVSGDAERCGKSNDSPPPRESTRKLAECVSPSELYYAKCRTPGTRDGHTGQFPRDSGDSMWLQIQVSRVFAETLRPPVAAGDEIARRL